MPALSFQVYKLLFSSREAELALGDQCAAAEIKVPVLLESFPGMHSSPFPPATALPFALGKPHPPPDVKMCPYCCQSGLFLPKVTKHPLLNLVEILRDLISSSESWEIPLISSNLKFGNADV